MKVKTILVLLGFFVLAANAQNKNAAIVANDAKVLYVTAMYPFSEGLAVVRNNQSFAVIDATGNIVIPFNKFTYNYNRYYPRFTNGMIRIQNERDGKEFYGFINKKAEVVFPIQFRHGVHFQPEGFATGWKYTSNTTWITHVLRKDGTESTLSNYTAANKYRFDWANPEEWKEGQCIILDLKPYLFGFISFTGKIISPVYVAVTPFSEGLAAVSKKDEMGNVKWGFINPKGETVIPFQFSNKPYPFVSGLSLFKPLSMPDYDYAYMDKTGKIVLKIKRKIGPDPTSWSPEAPNDGSSYGIFQGNFAIWGDRYVRDELLLMDKSGVEHSMNAILKKSGYKLLSWNPKIDNERMIVSLENEVTKVRGTGVISTNGEMIIPPVFAQLSFFDPISKLAYAEAQIGNKFVRGYINEKAIFVIVMGEKTGF